jgi:hypothetical protein
MSSCRTAAHVDVRTHGYRIGEVRDFLCMAKLWCLAEPKCKSIVKQELSRMQKLSKYASKSSLESFFEETENVAS